MARGAPDWTLKIQDPQVAIGTGMVQVSVTSSGTGTISSLGATRDILVEDDANFAGIKISATSAQSGAAAKLFTISQLPAMGRMRVRFRLKVSAAAGKAGHAFLRIFDEAGTELYEKALEPAAGAADDQTYDIELQYATTGGVVKVETEVVADAGGTATIAVESYLIYIEDFILG